MLRLERLCCGYGLFRAVSELDLEVPHGTITGLIGPNGAGKSSTLMCVAGHVDLQAGSIAFDEHMIGGLPATERVRCGIAIVPEGRRLFKDLSVEDNLRVGGLIHKASLFKADREYVLSLFPRLGDRLGRAFDGGAAGEAQTEQARHLVERLARGIVQSPAQPPDPSVPLHHHHVRVAAGDDQAQQREGRRGPAPSLVDPVRVEMALQVVHRDQREVAGVGERLGRVHAHQ